MCVVSILLLWFFISYFYSVFSFSCLFFFFFNDTATTEIYTLSLHDALPIFRSPADMPCPAIPRWTSRGAKDRKSTRLNSSHPSISYAVFCLKKKKNNKNKFFAIEHKQRTKHITIAPHKR